MAYTTEIVDVYGRTINVDNDNWADLVSDSSVLALDATATGNDDALKYRLTGSLEPSTTFINGLGTHADGGNNPIIANQIFLNLSATSSAIPTATNLHYHFFNSTIFLGGYTSTSSFTPLGAATVSSTVDIDTDNPATSGNISLHNCNLIYDIDQGRLNPRFAHLSNGTRFILLNSGRNVRFNILALQNGIIDDVYLDASSFSAEDLNGFRANIFQLRGQPQTFNDVTAVRLGFTGNAVETLWPSRLSAVDTPVHAWNGVNDQPTLIRADANVSSTGWLFPSPLIDVTRQGTIYGTHQPDRFNSRFIMASHWIPRYYDNATLQEDFVDEITANFNTNFNSTGTGYAATSLTNLTTNLEFTYKTNTDGYFEGDTDLSGNIDPDSDVEWRDIYVPIRTSSLSNGSFINAINTNASFNIATELDTTDHTTTCGLISPFGTIAEFITFDTTNSYVSSGNTYQDGVTPVTEYRDDSQTFDAPDVGMTHYTGANNAAKTTTIKNKFTSTGSVTPNDIAALFKIAIAETDDGSDSSYVDDFLKLDANPIWDISDSGRTFRNLTIDPTLSSEYTLSGSTFTVRAGSLVEETGANFIVTTVKCNQFEFSSPAFGGSASIGDNVIIESTGSMTIGDEVNIDEATLTAQSFDAEGDTEFTDTTLTTTNDLTLTGENVLEGVTFESTSGDITIGSDTTIRDSSTFNAVNISVGTTPTIALNTTFTASGDLTLPSDLSINFNVTAVDINWDSGSPNVNDFIIGGTINANIADGELQGGTTYSIGIDNDPDISDLTIGSIGGTGTATIEVADGVDGDTAFETANESVNNLTITLLAPAVVEEVTIPAHSTLGGFYQVVLSNSSVTTSGLATTRASFTAGTDVVYSLSSDDGWVDGDTLTVYFKYDSDVDNDEMYQELVRTHTFGSGSSSLAPPDRVVTALVNAIVDVSSNVTISVSSHTPVKATVPSVLVDVQNQAGGSSAVDFDQFESQGLAAIIGNTSGYFDAWFDNRATSTDPLLNYGGGNSAEWNTDVLGFGTGQESGGFRIQQLVSNWGDQAGTTNNFLAATEARTGAAEILSREAQQASLGSIVTAVDRSEMSSTLDDVNNKVSYPLTNGDRTTITNTIANSTATPKQQPYDAETDYTSIGES